MDSLKITFIAIPTILVLGIVILIAGNFFSLSEEVSTYEKEIANYNELTTETPLSVEKPIECVEQWECEVWSECGPDNAQTRTCRDTHDCGTEKTKPVLMKGCLYESPCEPNWICSEWNECFEGNNSRTCVDSNNCNRVNEKPEEKIECSSSTTDTTSANEHVFSNDTESTSQLPTTDCGISTIFTSNTPTNELEYESDAAFSCFGNNILSKCSPATMIVVNNDGISATYETSVHENVCNITLTKSGTFATCLVDYFNTKLEEGSDIKNNPGTYAASLYMLAEHDIHNENTTCVGTMITE